MTHYEQYCFILHVVLPAIEAEGLTIKTRRDGEFTLAADGNITLNFVHELRQHCLDALQRRVPYSPYGVSL
ncbi:hypothetical protein [Serratia microhaemolytica]|uniref:hypothetical protein n=1 Tax=Serratia microhaemolytica TaxID=2675110 RepID=UPI000FDF3EB0|nr:hypothetical protein [Serratia microhaemolytica]